jgi:hypothetical protein
MTAIRRTKLLTAPMHAVPDRMEAYRVEFAPGQGGGPHLHPGPVAGYVESGLIAFERDGHPMSELGPGDVFFEPAGETSIASTTSPLASRPRSSPSTWSMATNR